MKTSFIPAMEEFVRIPNLTRLYDPEWNTNGYLHEACNHCISFAKSLDIKGLEIELVQREGRTPLVFGIVDATSSQDQDKSIFVYGHIDKQPHLEGWKQGTGAITPAIIDGKLYGRGTADDGYSVYATMTIIKALHEFGVPHDRFILFFETDEESASIDVEFYLDDLKDRIGQPNLALCLDSGTVDYEHFTITSSLRGSILGTLSVKTISDGVHSGMWSGLIPCNFRIMRDVLSRIEDPKTGEMPEEFHVNIPSEKYIQLEQLAEYKGDTVLEGPFLEGVKPVTSNHLQTLINLGWKPTIVVTGMDGFPATKDAGNVLRPESKCIFSTRMPPTKDAVAASKRLKEILEANPPYESKIEYKITSAYSGWSAPAFPPDFQQVVDKAAEHGFGNGSKVLYLAMGGSIPIVNTLSEKFPSALFIVTGVLGPESNAHCPNEFLHLPFVEKLMNSLLMIVAEGSKVF